MNKSSIEWTDATWNPVRGCTKISPGCKNCYAETFAERWRGVPNHPYTQGFDLRLVPERLLDPIKLKKPHRIFVNSMSDLFQEGVPIEFIDSVFAVMALCPQHTFQVLTKRAVRMLAHFKNAQDLRDRIFAALHDSRIFPGDPRRALLGMPSRAGIAEGILKGWRSPCGDNVLLGVSVESQQYVNDRIAPLVALAKKGLRTMISVEPLLGPIKLPKSYLNLRDKAWVIVGGESGPGARPVDRQWVRDLRDQCVTSGVPFFFKQWGGVHKKAAGRRLDRRIWNEFPK